MQAMAGSLSVVVCVAWLGAYQWAAQGLANLGGLAFDSRGTLKGFRDLKCAMSEQELPTVVRGFLEDFEAYVAHLRFPVAHRKVIRTTNLIERLFVEERRRLKIIPNAFGERPVTKLMWSASTRTSDRWRGIKVTPFELKQWEVIRRELDELHVKRHAPATSSRKSRRGASPSRISSRNRT